MTRRPFRVRSRLLLGLLAIVGLMTAAAAVVIVEGTAMRHAFLVQEGLCRVESQLLECRRQEKNFILRRDQASRQAFANALEALAAETEQLPKQIASNGLSGDLGRLHEAARQYGIASVDAERLAGVGGEAQERLEALVVPRARACHKLIGELRTGAAIRFRRSTITTATVSVAAVIVGLLLSLVVALVLTRSIVAPLERLRQLAERASTGDLQDMDVAFRCLELEAGCSRECLDLADSLRRMLTSLRLLVPTEQGLMDTHQMAILVLVNRAVGPAGRAVVERAVRGAGLASLAEVGPATVEQFITALAAEVGHSIPEESLRVLVRAIRELRQ